jgi:tryptophan 2,3-dioxygenase
MESRAETILNQAMTDLDKWLPILSVDHFPYGSVIGCYHSVGKHFVQTDLLDKLADIRSKVADFRGSENDVRQLRCFLDTALDKHDGRYDYTTYLALSTLDLPADRPVNEVLPTAQRQNDRLIVQLICDILNFELDVYDGYTTLFPRLRPDKATTQRRFVTALKVIRPALRRLDLAVTEPITEPADMARAICTAVEDQMSAYEKRVLHLSMLPVYVAHDEYMFLRVLQSFEVTFFWVTVYLRAALAAFPSSLCQATQYIQASDKILGEILKLFALLSMMQRGAFQEFRIYTEGASAIQSRYYKTIESLCRQPDASRIDSIAYTSVPELRARLKAGQHNLDNAYAWARDSRSFETCDVAATAKAMRDFATTLQHWRQTHYGLACKMLGEATGTGYTKGTPYLKEVRTIPIFTTLNDAES